MTQARSIARRRQYDREMKRASRARRLAGRNLKIYCPNSPECRGHWVSADDCERERAAGRSYVYYPWGSTRWRARPVGSRLRRSAVQEQP